MSRGAARFQDALERRVFVAVVKSSSTKPTKAAMTGLKDLGVVQKLMSSPVLMAAFDLPWTPLFLFGISIFHPALGLLAIAGGAILVAATLLNRVFSKRPLQEAAVRSHKSDLLGEQIRTESEIVQAMGMRSAAFDRWQTSRMSAMTSTVQASDLSGGFTVATKTFRLFLQSAMLGLGAYLVLQNELTPEAMIAGAILMGRALAPIEPAIGQWALVQRASHGWKSLATLLDDVPPEAPRTQLPVPKSAPQNRTAFRHCPRRCAGDVAKRDLSSWTGSGRGHYRLIRVRQIHACARDHRSLAPGRWENQAGWRNSGSI